MEDRVVSVQDLTHLQKYEIDIGMWILLFWMVSTMLLWFIAFSHLPDSVPEWARRAQEICFGLGPNGLPNGGGWIVLTAAPLSLLLSIFAIYPSEIRESLHKGPFATNGNKALLILSFLALAEISWIANKIVKALSSNLIVSTREEGLPVGYPRLHKIVPSFELINQDGKNIKLGDFGGQTVFLTFAFAHCRTVCPLVVRNIQDTIDQVGGKVSLVIVTLDPWRDTQAALLPQSNSWKLGAQQHFLSGDPIAVNRLLDELAVPRERNATNGDLIHPALVYIIDREGFIAYSFNNPSVRWLVEAYNRLLED